MKACLINQDLISPRNLQACLVILALFLLAISPGKATTWYVSQIDGSDTTGTGTSTKPYQTIGKAVSVAQTSDTIDVGDGTYTETVTLTHGGTSTAPFNLQNWPGQAGVISGMTTIPSTAWTVYSGTGANTIYTTTVGSTSSPWKARDLFIQDTPTAIAKTSWKTISTCTGGGSGTTYTITVPSWGLNFTGGVDSSFIYIDQFGNNGSGTINAFLSYHILTLTDNGTTTTITFTGDGDSPYIDPGTDTIAVCNHPTLVTQNSWCYVDPGNGTTVLYYDPSLASDLNNTASRQRDYGLVISGLSYVNVSNFTIKGNLIYGVHVTSNASNVTFTKCVAYNCGDNEDVAGYCMCLDTCSNVTLQGCVITTGINGLGAVTQTNLTVKQSLIAYNENDGFDVNGRTGLPSNGITIEQCYLHHNMSINHADDLQFDMATSNVLIDSSCLSFSGQNIIGTVSNATATNNVFMNSYAININSGPWTLENNTCLFSNVGAYYNSGSIVNSLFYHAYIPYDGETSSDYNLFWNNNSSIMDAIASTASPFAEYTMTDVNDLNLYNKTGYEQHSTGVAPMLNNIPNTSAMVQNNPLSTLPGDEIFVTPMNACRFTGYFNIGDVVEINQDGVARSITATTPSGNGLILTLNPGGNCWHIGMVWDWPPGTTNLAIDTRPMTGSPAASGGSTGGERGSNINLVQFAAGSFDGTGTSDIPTIGGNITNIWSHTNNYPYYGMNP